MCEVMTAGAALIAVGSMVYQSMQQEKQGREAKKAAGHNTLIAMQAAADAEQRGALEASRTQSQTARMVARTKAIMLASGQDPTGAGVQDTLMGIASTGQTDALTARNNGARAAWGYRNQAATSQYEGQLAQSRANNEATGSLLTGMGYVFRAGAQAGGSKSGGLGDSGGSGGFATDGMLTSGD